MCLPSFRFLSIIVWPVSFLPSHTCRKWCGDRLPNNFFFINNILSVGCTLKSWFNLVWYFCDKRDIHKNACMHTNCFLLTHPEENIWPGET